MSSTTQRSVEIKLINGELVKFSSDDDERPVRVRHESDMAIITSKYGNETHIPHARIVVIDCQSFPERGGRSW